MFKIVEDSSRQDLEPWVWQTTNVSPFLYFHNEWKYDMEVVENIDPIALGTKSFLLYKIWSVQMIAVIWRVFVLQTVRKLLTDLIFLVKSHSSTFENCSCRPVRSEVQMSMKEQKWSWLCNELQVVWSCHLSEIP